MAAPLQISCFEPADLLLGHGLTPPSYKREDLKSAASVSRSRASRDDIQSLADEMLRALLSRSVSLASKSSSTAPPPSYRPALSTLSAPSTVRAGSLHAGRGKNSVGNCPPTVGSASISTTTSLTLVRESDSSSVRSSSSRVSAAEAKSRVRQLQLEVEPRQSRVATARHGGIVQNSVFDRPAVPNRYHVLYVPLYRRRETPGKKYRGRY